MSGYIETELVGNLGRDPKQVPHDDFLIVNFPVAVSDRKDKPTLWVDATFFDKKAELALEYLKKGQQVLIKGRPSARAYPAKDGSIKTVINLEGFKLVFLNGNKDDQNGSTGKDTQKNSE